MSRSRILLTILGLTFWAMPLVGLGEMSQAELREFTEQAIGQRAVSYTAPHFHPVRISSEYVRRYSLGEVDDFTQQYPSAGDLSVPLDEQFRVTLIRTYQNTFRERRWWEPRLAEIEREIGKMLRILDVAKPEDRSQLLYDSQQRIWQVYEKALYDKGIEPEKGAAGATYTIEFRTDPEEGQVSYLPAGDWDLYLFRTKKGVKDIEVPSWHSVDRPMIEIGGKYWVAVSWGGKTRYNKLHHFTQSTVLTLRPND